MGAGRPRRRRRARKCAISVSLVEHAGSRGRRILAAHILDGATGWYMGTVQNFGVGVSWKQPDATHIVLYKKSETKLKELDGRVACKLTADNYGRSEWWLLLERMES